MDEGGGAVDGEGFFAVFGDGVRGWGFDDYYN